MACWARSTESSDLPGQAADLLAQAQRRGVHQVRATDLDDLVPVAGLWPPAVRAVARSAGSRSLLDLQRHRHVNRRGKGVVGALPHVHVIVGMNRLLRREAIAPQQISIARLAITSLTFMLLDVPEPV